MGQSIQEWTKSMLWKTTFKKLTSSTYEYFVSYGIPVKVNHWQITGNHGAITDVRGREWYEKYFQI